MPLGTESLPKPILVRDGAISPVTISGTEENTDATSVKPPELAKRLPTVSQGGNTPLILPGTSTDASLNNSRYVEAVSLADLSDGATGPCIVGAIKEGPASNKSIPNGEWTQVVRRPAKKKQDNAAVVGSMKPNENTSIKARNRNAHLHLYNLHQHQQQSTPLQTICSHLI